MSAKYAAAPPKTARRINALYAEQEKINLKNSNTDI